MIVHLTLICELDSARLYKLSEQEVFWLPNKAIKNTVRRANVHIVSVDDEWWSEYKNKKENK